MIYIQITFTNTSNAQNDILTALLSNIGFEGFEEDTSFFKAFIKQINFDKDSLEEIVTTFQLTYEVETIAQQNWNQLWESSFEPVIINDFVAIRASFHTPVRNIEHEIIITPKMSFGTGHHATTYLMMEQMRQIDFANKSVFDFGTGTGVLTILAKKMGAPNVFAIDNDDWSIDNAIENIKTNHVDNIDVQKADTINTSKQYDIILANINLNVILQNMQAIVSVCKSGGKILLSGFLLADEDSISTSLNSNKLTLSNLTKKNGWICIQALKD